MAITYETRLNMTPGDYPPIITVSQYDSDFSLKFNLYSSAGTLILASETTAAVRGTKKDGNGYSATASLTGSVVTVTGDVQMTAIAGDNIFEIVLTKNNKELSSTNFILHVERAALDKDTLGVGSKIRELVNVIDRTDEIIAAANRAESAVQAVHDDIETAADDAAAAVRTELQSYLADAQTARSQAQNAAQSAASAVRTELQSYLADAQTARSQAQNAAQSAALDVAGQLEHYLTDAKSEMQQYLSHVQVLRTQTEDARDEAQAAASTAASEAAANLQDTFTDLRTAMTALLDVLKARNVISEEAYDYIIDIL